MWGLLGFAATVFSLVIDGIKGLRRIRQTKNKQSKVEIPNRDALVRAIAEVASTAITFLVRTREVHQWSLTMLSESARPKAYESAHARDDARVAYQAAREKLSQEKLVAGYAFRAPISDFITCIMKHFDEGSELKPKDASGIIDINLKAEETVKQIDAIVSDKESS